MANVHVSFPGYVILSRGRICWIERREKRERRKERENGKRGGEQGCDKCSMHIGSMQPVFLEAQRCMAADVEDEDSRLCIRL